MLLITNVKLEKSVRIVSNSKVGFQTLCFLGVLVTHARVIVCVQSALWPTGLTARLTVGLMPGEPRVSPE